MDQARLESEPRAVLAAAASAAGGLYVVSTILTPLYPLYGAGLVTEVTSWNH